eukprot:1646318-Rhodomonas_salina.1
MTLSTYPVSPSPSIPTDPPRPSCPPSICLCGLLNTPHLFPFLAPCSLQPLRAFWDLLWARSRPSKPASLRAAACSALRISEQRRAQAWRSLQRLGFRVQGRLPSAGDECRDGKSNGKRSACSDPERTRQRWHRGVDAATPRNQIQETAISAHFVPGIGHGRRRLSGPSVGGLGGALESFLCAVALACDASVQRWGLGGQI